MLVTKNLYIQSAYEKLQIISKNNRNKQQEKIGEK